MTGVPKPPNPLKGYGIGVAVLGDINIDVLMSIPEYPQPGGEALTERLVTGVGGSAANTAIVLTRLGLAARMIGRVGRDPWGEMALNSLIESSVDTSHVQRDDQAPTGMMFNPVTPDGERTMFGQRGANALTDPGSIVEDALAGMQFLHLSGYALLEPPQREAALRTVMLAEDVGIPIGMDTAWLPAFTVPGEIRALLPRLAVCVLGREEATLLSGKDEPETAASYLVEAGGSMIALKRGRAGCLLADETGVTVIPAFPVDAVDSTGAGDAFSAGLIYGYLNGLTVPAMGVLANALGSLAVRVWGAGNSLPGKMEVRGLLEMGLKSAVGVQKDWVSEALQSVTGL